jgi:hypothetical protein
VQVLGTSGEDATVDEVADVTLSYPSIAHHNVGAGIVGDDLIENARQPGTVEL